MYNVINILAPSNLIESSSFLQVTRTTIITPKKLARSDKGLWSWLPLSILKNPHRLIRVENVVAGGWDNHMSMNEFEIPPNRTMDCS